MHHMDQAGFNIGASITAIMPMAQVVYTGDEDGRVVSCTAAHTDFNVTDVLSSMNGIAFSASDGSWTYLRSSIRARRTWV